MKKYTPPTVLFVNLDLKDVICTSDTLTGGHGHQPEKAESPRHGHIWDE